MELSQERLKLYQRIRAGAGSALNAALARTGEKFFSVSAFEVTQNLRRQFIQCDTADVIAALSDALPSGWSVDATGQTFTFDASKVNVQPPPAPQAAPKVDLSEAAKDQANRAHVRWVSNYANVQQKYPSFVQFQEAIQLGLETV